jgi:hypothetical protein
VFTCFALFLTKIKGFTNQEAIYLIKWLAAATFRKFKAPYRHACAIIVTRQISFIVMKQLMFQLLTYPVLFVLNNVHSTHHVISSSSNSRFNLVISSRSSSICPVVSDERCFNSSRSRKIAAANDYSSFCRMSQNRVLYQYGMV